VNLFSLFMVELA